MEGTSNGSDAVSTYDVLHPNPATHHDIYDCTPVLKPYIGYGFCMVSMRHSAALQAHAEACAAIGHAKVAISLLEMDASTDDASLQQTCYALAAAFFPR